MTDTMTGIIWATNSGTYYNTAPVICEGYGGEFATYFGRLAGELEQNVTFGKYPLGDFVVYRRLTRERV